MAIEGPLRELGIHDVFQLLDLSRKTGVLRVNSELRHNAGTLYFEAGAIIFAEIRSNPHPLGAALLRAGKITEADLDRARDMQERLGDKRRLGDILVSLGAITARELQRQVRFQIEEVVFEVMSWREGYFSFTDGALTDLPSGATVRIPTEALLMEGARRIDEWSRMESRIPHLGVVPTLAPLDKNTAAPVHHRPRARALRLRSRQDAVRPRQCGSDHPHGLGDRPARWRDPPWGPGRARGASGGRARPQGPRARPRDGPAGGGARAARCRAALAARPH